MNHPFDNRDEATLRTDVWLTPPFILDALGGAESFDLDPCAPEVQPWPTARRTYTERENGLVQPWEGRIWLNPPYSARLLSAFLARMAAHRCGTALIFARTDTRAFFEHVWSAASALLFLRSRLNFHEPDGRRSRANAGAPSVLVAYGEFDADVLATEPLAGQFVPLRVPRRWILGFAAGGTWREALARFFEDREEPVPLAEIYRAFASHPKAAGNRHYREKLRQTLQQGRYVAVGRGVWTREPSLFEGEHDPSPTDRRETIATSLHA